MNQLDVLWILVDEELTPVHQDEPFPGSLQSILAVFQVPLKPLLGIDLGLLQGQENLLA